MDIEASTIKQISLNRGRNDICEEIARFITVEGDKYHLNVPQRVKHFLGQVCIESAFMTRLEESLNYSAERMTVVWPNRFPNIASAQPYAHNPRALAMKTYGNRADLGNKTAEDGWLFYGRGPKQLTGRFNYTAFNTWIHKLFPDAPNFVEHPELVIDFKWMMYSAAWFWEVNNCWKFADLDDAKGVTRSINGGLTDFPARLQATALAGKILNMRVNPPTIDVKPVGIDPLLKQYQGYLKALSVALNNPEFDPGIADGLTGKKTTAAVMAIQTATKLYVDGKLGPNTRKAIDLLCDKAGVNRGL